MTLANGLLDESVLTVTSGDRPLFTPAALSFERLAGGFRAQFGKALTFGAGWTGYRTRLQQQILFNQLGYPAAAYPGTSNHGLGLAADLNAGIQVYGSAQWSWMNTVGRTHGWTPLNEKNLRFEPWHWVYVLILDRHYLSPEPIPAPAPAPTPTPAPEDDVATVALIRTPDQVIWEVGQFTILRVPDMATVYAIAKVNRLPEPWVEVTQAEFEAHLQQMYRRIDAYGTSLKGQGL